MRRILNRIFRRAIPTAVFVHVPKTGGNSMLSHFRRHRIEILTHDLRSSEYRPLTFYRERAPTKQAPFFSFVRNPFDRVVSAFHYLQQGGINEGDRNDAEKYVLPYETFDEFVSRAFVDSDVIKQIHFRPQFKWLCDSEGNLLVDHLGHLESIQHDLDQIARLVGFPSIELTRANSSKHENYRRYFTEGSAQVIREVYQQDFELFGYDDRAPN